MKTIHHIGIDVSKNTLQVHGPNLPATCPNRASALKAWLKKLPDESHLVLEASGGYEKILVALAHEAGVPVSIVNPARVRAFANAQGQRAKTDPIDAAVLARFGERMQPPPTPPAPPAQRRCAELVRARQAMVRARILWSNLIEHAEDAGIAKTYRKHLRQADASIARFEREILAEISSCPALNARYQKLVATFGVGAVAASTLVSELPELGRVNRKQVAALCGLAPFPKDSGQKRGARFVQGGRANLRRALYMATLAAVRSKTSPLGDFYRRLREKGKPAKVAIIACARKLVTYLNSILKDPTPKTA